MKRKILSVLLIVSVSAFLVFSACDRTGYKGTHADLFTVTSNSVLGVWGDADTIIVLEEDDYGRRMYFHWGNSRIADKEGGYDGYEYWAIIICQKTDSKGKFTYFYPDENLLLFKVAFPDDDNYVGQFDRLKEIAYTLTTEKELNDLKSRNDWNKPINEAKCAKVKVSRTNRGIEDKLLSKSKKMEICNSLRLGSTQREWADYYLTSDKYNRHIYFLKDMKNNEHQCSYLLMLIPGSSYQVVELNDPWSFQEDLVRFKVDNNWNVPIVILSPFG